jgi:hypothetical protein
VNNIELNLSRGASLAMRQEKSKLFTFYIPYRLHKLKDSAIWLWEVIGSYTIKSMYNFLCFGSIETNLSKSLWVLKISLKYFSLDGVK